MELLSLVLILEGISVAPLPPAGWPSGSLEGVAVRTQAGQACLSRPGETRGCLHSRGSSRVPCTSRGAPFPPPSSRGGFLSLHVRERIPSLPIAAQEGALSTGKARGNPGSCHIPRVPQMTQSIPGKTVFPEVSRLSSRGSTHTTVARGTALWESLVGKPRGKASLESP